MLLTQNVMVVCVIKHYKDSSLIIPSIHSCFDIGTELLINIILNFKHFFSLQMYNIFFKIPNI